MNFFKRLFTNQADKMTAEQIEREYIFNELDLEEWCGPFFEKDFTQTMHVELSEPEYMYLHEKFGQGAKIIPHITSNTSIELFIDSEKIQLEDIVRTGITVKHACSTYDAIIIEVSVWMRDNTIETILFKLNISHEDERARLATALISVQETIPFYFGHIDKGLFVSEKKIDMETTELFRESTQIFLVELYTNETSNHALFIETEDISDQEMTTAGWTWHLDNEELTVEENDLAFIKDKLSQIIFEKIEGLSMPGYYTGWIAENVGQQDGTGSFGETTTIILTSSESLHVKGELYQEITEFLKSLRAGMREEEGYPLKYESIPLYRRGENGFGKVSINESLLTRADELYTKMTNHPNNYYRKLRNIKVEK